MQALWLENQRLDIRSLPEPVKPGEALIRIRVAGICSTDLELVKGYYPFTGILGTSSRRSGLYPCQPCPTHPIRQIPQITATQRIWEKWRV
jgi:hypothetical protein